MSEHSARVEWQRAADEAFIDQRYSRRHRLHFDGGAAFAGSASPSVVPAPWSDPAAVDPEELFVAALASCHMLWFLSLAAAAGWCVDHYSDDALGTLALNAQGRQAMAVVTLRPEVRFAGERRPDAAQRAELHHRAHERCFIAQSVLTDVRVEPQP